MNTGTARSSKASKSKEREESEAELKSEAAAIEKLRVELSAQGAAADKKQVAEFAKRQKAYLDRKIDFEKLKRSSDSSAPEPVKAKPAAPEPVKPAPAPSSASIESGYVATVRAQLNANKRYPTGREASLQRPSGKAVVWFVLNRNGALNDAGIEDSSNSIILDNAALSTVRRTPYAAWPEGSWPGQSQHRFTVTLDFAPVN